MIYQIYFTTIRINLSILAELVDLSAKEDKFIIIYSYDQEMEIENMLQTYKLPVAYHSPAYIYNFTMSRIYPRIKILILGKEKVEVIKHE
jgi:hypothetical protein